MCVNQERPAKRNANILSFDGGGSKGIMEVAILDYVMRLVTILQENPKSLQYLTEDGMLALDRSKSLGLVASISNVTDPIHPTKVFDMIVGTSTGGLIAFALVGGKTDSNGKRVPMSLRECIEMYLSKTEKIFEKTLFQKVVAFFSSVPLMAYSQDNLQKVLLDQFGKSMLEDFRDSESVAGIVARKIGQNEELVLFDTKNDHYKFYETRQVLLATAAAPVYFKTPVKIGSHEYVDGGVGGNCPLVQAIPRARELFGRVKFVLSVAPPPPKEIKIPSSYFQIMYWLTYYFVHQSTDGYAVYKDAKNRHKSGFFRRFMPRGKNLQDFHLDETDAKKMLDGIEDELNDEFFLLDVIATATFVLKAYIDRQGKDVAKSSVEVGAKLAHRAAIIYADRFEYGKAEDSFNLSLDLWNKITDGKAKKSIAETESDFSECLINQGKYHEALKHAKNSLDTWQAFHGYKDHENISKVLYLCGKSQHLIGRYKEGYKTVESALEMQRRIYGKDGSNLLTATILRHMAWISREEGESEKAKGLSTSALFILKQLFDEGDHIEVARTLDNLGLCFFDQKEFNKSEEYFWNALKMKKRLLQLGNEIHPALAASYNNLGLCLTHQKKFQLSEHYLQKALEMKDALHKEHKHKSVAITLTNLAINCVLQGEYNAGLEYAQQAFDIEKSHLVNIKSPTVAKTLHVTALCLVSATKFAEAHKYINKAIEMIEDIFESKDHPSLVECLITLGDALLGLGNYSDAEVHLKHALKIIEEQPGINDRPDSHKIFRKLKLIFIEKGANNDQNQNDDHDHTDPEDSKQLQIQQPHREF